MEMNDDLISRKALLEEFDRVCVDGVMAHGANVNLEIEFVRAVQKAPAVDPHKHGRWISVKHRLPEEKTRVLVFVPHSSIKIDTDRIVGRIWVRWNGHVTNWMPLPEPPEEEAHTNGD